MGVLEKTVLLVDDEPGFHDLFRYLLEPLGISVHSAYDGAQGLDCVAKRDYAIIFLDIHMPKMLGTEVLRKVRALKPAQPVALLSSDSDPQHLLEQTAKEMRVDLFLSKPFDSDRVLEVVEEFVTPER